MNPITYDNKNPPLTFDVIPTSVLLYLSRYIKERVKNKDLRKSIKSLHRRSWLVKCIYVQSFPDHVVFR